MNKIIATGSSYGALPSNDYARQAVENALAKMQDCTAGSVLLFLTNGYAYNPEAAIKQAARAAKTTQVFGCCAVGLLTEQEWLFDVEGAVAMVFPSDYSLQPANVLQSSDTLSDLLLTISTPNAATTAVNATSTSQFGSICTDEYGHGPFSVWQGGRVLEQGYFHAGFHRDKVTHTTHVAHGVQQISPIMRINKSKGHSLIEVDEQTAVSNLVETVPDNVHGISAKQPYNILGAIGENTTVEAIEQGYYKLKHIVSIDEVKQVIYLSGTVQQDRPMFWAMRDETKAQQEMQKALTDSIKQLPGIPDFAFMFPNVGRGPEFFNGIDQDLALFKENFPDTPVIGFYGNGEIAPGHKLAGLINRYATVFSLFSVLDE